MPYKHKNKPLRQYPANKLLERLQGHDTYIANLLGVRRVTLNEWRTNNTHFSCWRADRLAIRAGYHPAQIWPDWLDIYPPTTHKGN